MTTKLNVPLTLKVNAAKLQSISTAIQFTSTTAI